MNKSEEPGIQPPITNCCFNGIKGTDDEMPCTNKHNNTVICRDNIFFLKKNRSWGKEIRLNSIGRVLATMNCTSSQELCLLNRVVALN